MALNATNAPTRAARVEAFARFFKSYMSVSAVVVASLPIPLTSLGAIPTFGAQRAFLSTYTSLFCFLLLGFIFYSRHILAKWFFPDIAGSRTAPSTSAVDTMWDHLFVGLRGFLSVFVRLLPFLLICSALFMTYRYHQILTEAVVIARAEWTLEKLVDAPVGSPRVEEASSDLTQLREMEYGASSFFVPIRQGRFARRVLSASGLPATPTVSNLLKEVPLDRVPAAHSLMASHLAMFLCAEAAFVLMAIREYLQDTLGLSDETQILGSRAVASKPR